MKRFPLFIGILLWCTGAGTVSAQTGQGAGTASTPTAQQQLDALSQQMKRLNDLSARLPSSVKASLSGGAQNMLSLAAHWDELGLSNGLALNAPLPQQAASAPLPPGLVSDPRQDLKVSRMAGFTQNETSTAWCGSTVVVGYNDSGSFLETFPVPTIGLSFNGYSRSADGGETFTDLGFLNPGSNTSGVLGGDPVVVCSDENTFYYSSIFSSSPVSTDISVSKSTDGGQTFGDPVSAVSKPSFFPDFHFLDKPWMAVDPTNADRLYVTYTDFETNFPGGGGCLLRTGIELVTSADGGLTWSSPTVVAESCSPTFSAPPTVLQGSNVAVDDDGTVFVAWEELPPLPPLPGKLPINKINIARSTDNGRSFEPKTVVSDVTPVGYVALGLLQGGFRNNEFPSLAIDRSQGPGGLMYITWNDGRDGVTPDMIGLFSSLYDFGDVLISRSDDGGATWSTPLKVNDNCDAASSNPVDHYQPGVAVDRDGSVGVCWYDRRFDPQNFNIDRECALSRDGGATFGNFRVTRNSFSATINQDLLVNPVYMGDYDTVAADSTGASCGFLGSYGDNTLGNPDVKISPLFGAE
jgi:hypothetical protein